MRQISYGTVWAVGGGASADGVNGVSNGRGGLLASGSSAPLHRTNFLDRINAAAEREAHEHRIALALDIDTAARVLPPTTRTSTPWGNHSPTVKSHQSFQHTHAFGSTVWKDGEWIKEGSTTTPKKTPKAKRAVPIIPFRVLDAPSLRDDFYCSLLAYSASAKCLAVGLGSHVYLWSEGHGVDTPESLNTPYHAHVTSLSFSSPQGKKDILAIGRACGRLLLWSPSDEVPRLTSMHPTPVCCVSFRPNTVKRPSKRDRYIEVNTEELILGDEVGHIYFYSVEWPTQDQYDLFGFPGDLNLLCRITIHTQQICGLAWSLDGDFFASGGNDNICHLFETKRVLQHTSKEQFDGTSFTNAPVSGPRTVNINTNGESFNLGPFVARHQWTVLAAVKAIAFCPWQRGLIAVGGGSNDRCIHFYHTLSGACLATIDCSAQVTSLIWSTTRREIAATFGFAQPEHPYRIAVFSWPKCEVVVRIPWFEEHRALFAIPYPGGPNNGLSKGEGGVWWSRTQEEGCIVVATSDSSIKFHEVWAEERRSVNSKEGLLGGSDILESLHGIEKEQAEVIR
jgi:WD40 repeat protein